MSEDLAVRLCTAIVQSESAINAGLGIIVAMAVVCLVCQIADLTGINRLIRRSKDPESVYSRRHNQIYMIDEHHH